MKQHYTFRTLFSQILAQRQEFWHASLYGVLSVLLLLPVPLFIPLLIDEVLMHRKSTVSTFFEMQLGVTAPWFVVAMILLGMLLLRLFAFILTNRQSFLSVEISQRVGYLLREKLLGHLEQVSLSEYETIKSGSIVAKNMQDVEGVSRFAGQFVSTFLSAAVMLIGVALIMVWLHWVLALIIFLMHPLFFGFSQILGRQTSKLLKKQYEAYEVYQELLTETVELFTQVRTSNREASFFDLLRFRAAKIESSALEYGYQASVTQGTSSLFTYVMVDIFRAVAVIVVAYSDLSIGMMVAFFFYLTALVSPVQKLMGLVVTYQQTKPALERINALLALEHEPHYATLQNPFNGQKSVSVVFKEVHFSYGGEAEVLQGVTIEVKAGETIALYGESGSGKSTIAQIMVGVYRPDSGEVFYDGIPVAEIGLPVVREHVALVLQDSLFFNDTIRMNLTFGDNLDEREIYQALQYAQLETFVKGLPDGLDTVIGKNGIRLSGGEKQRLAIARMVLSDPKVVILDESTSALDSETEKRLFEGMAPFLKQRTVILIAHRLSTMQYAERLLEVTHGNILEK